MKLVPASRILLFIVALLTISQLGCVPIGSPGSSTPEEAALRVDPPRNGAKRFSVVKPAPGGALVVFEEIARLSGDPTLVEIGYAYVTRQASGWLPSGAGWAGGQPQRSVLLEISSYGSSNERMIIFGKVVDPRVVQVVVGFPGGQVWDTTVNGLFGIVVVPEAPLCKLELLDAEERQVELFDFSGTALDLAEILHGQAAHGKEACALVPKSEP